MGDAHRKQPQVLVPGHDGVGRLAVEGGNHGIETVGGSHSWPGAARVGGSHSCPGATREEGGSRPLHCRWVY